MQNKPEEEKGLHVLAKEGGVEEFEKALEKEIDIGAALKSRDKKGNTPLHVAIVGGKN